jgi:hypothetical protein
LIRKLVLLNLALAGVLLLIVHVLRQRWQEGEVRRDKIVQAPIAPAHVEPPPPRPMVQPLTATAYVDVAQKVLFSRDRNPDVIPPPPAPPPPPPKIPPFPAAHGVMIWGKVPPSIILSVGKDEQRVYRAGDKVGEFEIASIDEQHLVLTWNGQTFVKNISDLEALAAPAQEQQQAANLPPPPVSAPPPTAPQNGPGISMDSEGKMKTCDVTDTNPMGTVINGYKKVPLVNPMAPGGHFCLWQSVN